MEFTSEMEKMLLDSGVAVVATASPEGVPNAALKSVISVSREEGTIGFLDLFDGKTSRNLKANPNLSLSVFNLHEYAGYQFTGTARIAKEGNICPETLGKWQKKRWRLISQRIQRNVRQGFSGGGSEAALPAPRALISLKVENIYPL